MDVIEKAKRGWQRRQLLKEMEPGHRFQTRYNNHRRRREQGETWKYGRIFNLVGGPALIAAGFAFVPTPGPSYIIIVIGLWMLAGEFLSLARLFDRIGMRELGRWIRDSWTGSSAAAKIITILAILLCAVALGSWLIV